MNSATNYLFKARVSAQQLYAFIGIPHDSATSLGNPGARFAARLMLDFISTRVRAGIAQ